MDSMDWFNPDEDAAAKQAQALNRAMKMGGRILLRSASIEPWYIKDFEANGFTPRRVGARFPGSCIDRYFPFFSSLMKQIKANLCHCQRQHVRICVYHHQNRRNRLESPFRSQSSQQC